MKISQKPILDYLKAARIPLILLGLFLLGGIVYAYLDYAAYSGLFGHPLAMLAPIIIMLYLGWSTVVDERFEIRHAVWGCVIVGFIYGLASALVGVLLYYTIPGIVDIARQLAISKGTPPEYLANLEMFMAIGVFVNLILVPIIYMIIGAVTGLLGGWIGKKTTSS